MTFKNILPDQHIVLKCIRKLKKSVAKGLTNERGFVFKSIFYIEMCTETKILAESGSVIHLILQCSHCPPTVQVLMV